MSVYQMSLFGGSAIGSWIWGELASRLAVETALYLAASFLAASIIAGKAFPLVQHDQFDLSPLFDEQELANRERLYPKLDPPHQGGRKNLP
jgi:hypothetical protein